jgi:hypothetical protein
MGPGQRWLPDGQGPGEPIDSCGYRLVNRNRADVTDRYPELGFLQDLPAGVVLDGEVVVLRQGKPDFGLLLSRNQARAPLKIQSLARTFPATYIVFKLIHPPGEGLDAIENGCSSARTELPYRRRNWNCPGAYCSSRFTIIPIHPSESSDLKSTISGITDSYAKSVTP